MVFKDLNRFILPAAVLLLLTLPAWGNLNFIKDNTLFNQQPKSGQAESQETEKAHWQELMGKHQGWDELVDYDENKYQVEYTFNDELESFIKKQLQLYHPDFTSVVVMDNATGHILAAVDYARAKKVFGRDLAFTTTHPAASIIKVITAAELLENTHVNVDTDFSFTGKSTTLYKSQLKEPRNRRWMRTIDFEKAFASSNNVIFGRSAIENVTPAGLKKMAERFGFNRKILDGVNLADSHFPIASSQYNLAELGSGLNRTTVMSPVHGAVIASIVANGGVMKHPVVIKKLTGVNDKKILFPPVQEDEQVITPKTAEDLKQLFMATVSRGTARSSFKRSKSLLAKYEIGGKTGSITGGIPMGKRDWFVSYAKSSEDKTDKGISIAIMIVNQKKWYVKSPLLAKNIIEHYYSKINQKKE